MSQSNDESQGSGAEQDSVGTHVTWSQYTSLEESPVSLASWSHRAQGNGEPPEELYPDHLSDSTQTLNDVHPSALETSQEAMSSPTGSQEDNTDDQEEAERRAPRFATPTCGGSPIKGNGPVPHIGEHDEDGDY